MTYGTTMRRVCLLTILAGTALWLPGAGTGWLDARSQVAQSVCAAQDAPFCIVQIITTDGNGQQSQGTGVLLADGRVLTAAHVVQMPGCSSPGIQVLFGGRNGQSVFDGASGRTINIWASDRMQFAAISQAPGGDLAILSGVSHPSWATGVTIAANEPAIGDLLTSVGLESPNAIRVHAAPRVRGDSQGDNGIFLRIGVSAQPGDSGGPVFNNSGELVGINSSISDYTETRINTPPPMVVRGDNFTVSFQPPSTFTFERCRYTSITNLHRFSGLR